MAAVREFEESQMDSEMEILLSDNGPAKLILLHGGSLIECDGKLYVVPRESFNPFYSPPLYVPR